MTFAAGVLITAVGCPPSARQSGTSVATPRANVIAFGAAQPLHVHNVVPVPNVNVPANDGQSAMAWVG